MKIKAYAKINLILDVLSKREDGYHNIDFLMTSLDLYDEISIEKSNKDEVVVIGNEKLSNKNNLAFKALKLIKENYSVTNNYKIIIKKNIPIAAGLAGGSTDAAAVLKGINEIEKLNINIKNLEDLAIILGSDVPFCLHSCLCKVKGKGEIVEEIENTFSKYYVLMINNGKELSTKEVYDNYKQNKVDKKDIDTILLLDDEKFYKNLRNDLESVATYLEPSINDIKNDILKVDNVTKVIVSGSGPTVLAFDRNYDKLFKIQKELENKYDYIKIYKML